MNKKIFAAVFSMALLCSCGNGNAGEQSETGSESVSLASGSASETTVTTASAETTSEAVSEETEIITEVSEAEENVPITRDFFNDDVVFEEVMLPVKVTAYHNDGTEKYEKYSFTYEYDAAGNKSKSQMYTYEYDYNPDGTYNSVFEYYGGKLIEKIEYKFDSEGRLIRTSKFRNGKKYGFEYTYTYDEAGRLYEEIFLYQDEFNGTDFSDYHCHRHEYDGNIENVYFFSNEELTGSVTYEYEGDKLKKEMSPTDNYLWEYFYDENNRLVKEIYTYDGGGFFIEYFYNDDGSMILREYDGVGVLTYEMEYAMIPKIKTDIEYKFYYEVNP